MASTHLSLHDHLVFSTKNREHWLSPTHRQRVHEYIGGIIRNIDGVAHAVGGTGDHIHIAAGLRAPHCLADVMREVKSESSRWIHEEPRLRFAARNSERIAGFGGVRRFFAKPGGTIARRLARLRRVAGV